MKVESDISLVVQKSGLFIRILYTLALLAFVPSLLAGSSGWMALVLGGGLISTAGVTISLVVCALIIYRSYLVLRYPSTLDARKPNIAGKFLRALGIFSMLVGALAAIGLFLVKPITLALFKSAGDGGIGYFVVGLYLVILANLGWVGCITFELSRVLGVKPPKAEKKFRPTRKQDMAALSLLVVTAIALPLLLQRQQEKPCGERNLAQCASRTEAAVRRVISLAPEEQVFLNSNVEEIVMRRGSGDGSWNLIENPLTSLAATGHFISTSPDTKVRVDIEASPSPNGVTLLLTVHDDEEETARFVTQFSKDSAIETMTTGKIRIIVPLPSNAKPGMRPSRQNPETRKDYSLDQIFIQLRRAIGDELEVREWPLHIERPAKLITNDVDAHTSYEDAYFSASCLNKVSGGPSTVIAFETEIGWNLSGATFAASAVPGPHTLLSNRDEVSCRDDEVWIVSYRTRRPDLRIRRYSIDGRLLRFIDTNIPSPSLGSHEYERVDPSSIREEDNKIHFERVILKTKIGSSQEVRRELFEINL